MELASAAAVLEEAHSSARGAGSDLQRRRLVERLAHAVLPDWQGQLLQRAGGQPGGQQGQLSEDRVLAGLAVRLCDQALVE